MPTRLPMACLILLTALLVPASLRAEITSLAGSAESTLWEFRLGDLANQDGLTLTYPNPQSTLPLQAVVSLSNSAEEAAGAVATQFADPREATGANPQNLALILSLNSVSPQLSYQGRAAAQDIRTITLSPAEAGAANGATANLVGRFFLDGAIGLYAGDATGDLTGASVSFAFTVVQDISGQSPQTLAQGQIELAGGPDRQVTLTRTGDFPSLGVFRTDLSAIDPELDVFEVVVFPQLVVSYNYQAPVGEAFLLRADVTLEGTNLGNEVGVSAGIGTPLRSIEGLDVFTTEATATPLGAKTLAALEVERAAPTGQPAFEPAAPLLGVGVCGLFGVESVLGFFVMLHVGARCALRRPAQRFE
jgi:hypothetical protein